MEIRTDFNEVHDDDYVWAVLPTAQLSHMPAPGEWVYLFDRDGASCYAIVTTSGRRAIDCKIDWSTWSDFRSEVHDFFGGYQPARIDIPA